ncbi:hypothetical protein ACH4JS_14000 [Streptomyces sp. NPDC017638]|uniref:hypothetical protein n=1 Tax=Streptomyces sp. NPDC017638 TaxID=3365004 RepID=UPI00378BA54B
MPAAVRTSLPFSRPGDAGRALLVRWSYGAPGGAHGAHRNPGRHLGTAPVDGARP